MPDVCQTRSAPAGVASGASLGSDRNTRAARDVPRPCSQSPRLRVAAKRRKIAPRKRRACSAFQRAHLPDHVVPTAAWVLARRRPAVHGRLPATRLVPPEPARHRTADRPGDRGEDAGTVSDTTRGASPQAPWMHGRHHGRPRGLPGNRVPPSAHPVAARGDRPAHRATAPAAFPGLAGPASPGTARPPRGASRHAWPEGSAQAAPSTAGEGVPLPAAPRRRSGSAAPSHPRSGRAPARGQRGAGTRTTAAPSHAERGGTRRGNGRPRGGCYAMGDAPTPAARTPARSPARLRRLTRTAPTRVPTRARRRAWAIGAQDAWRSPLTPWCHPALRRWARGGRASRGVWRGRDPTAQGRTSASHRGAMTRGSALGTTRACPGGLPSGRVGPGAPAVGLGPRRSGAARSCPVRRAVALSSRPRPAPDAWIVTPSRRAPPAAPVWADTRRPAAARSARRHPVSSRSVPRLPGGGVAVRSRVRGRWRAGSRRVRDGGWGGRRPARGPPSSLALRRTREARSGPALPSVFPRGTGTLPPSDSLDRLGPARAGAARRRVPRGQPRGRRALQGRSGSGDGRSGRATVLDPVPAGQRRPCAPRVRSRLRRQGSGSPRNQCPLRRSIRWWGERGGPDVHGGCGPHRRLAFPPTLEGDVVPLLVDQVPSPRGDLALRGARHALR